MTTDVRYTEMTGNNTTPIDLAGTTARPLYAGEASIHIAAPPEVVYARVADITHMGEYSPECRHCEWLDGATGPAVAVRFRGDNKGGFARWSRTCEIVVADRGHEFAFRTLPTRFARDSTLWRYRFEPTDGGGTTVTESYALTDAWLPVRIGEVVTRRPHKMPGNLRQTLDRIKAAAEGRAAHA